MIDLNGSDFAYFVDLDAANSVYVLGQDLSRDYPVTPGVYSDDQGGTFLHKMNSGLTNTDFSTTTTQFVNQALQGSKVTKVDYAQMGQQKNVCALVTVSEDNAKRLFERVINSAPTKLSPEDETLLYLNFLKSENQL